jgi:hypothetical protein
MEFTLLAAAAIGVACFWLMLRWEAGRGNASACSVDLWDAGIGAAAVGLLAGRVTAMAQAGINPLSDPSQILLVRSGVSTAGAAIAAMAVFAVLARHDLVAAADGVSAATLAGLAGWHSGCLATDSCLGTVSGLPWAFSLDGSEVTRHPVGLYTAALLMGAAVGIAVWKMRGRPPAGGPSGTALAAAGGIMLVTEPLRISLDQPPIALYAAGAVMGALVVAAAFAARRAARTRARPDGPTAP